MEGTVRDIRRSFKDRPHCSKNFQLIHRTRVRVSIVTKPVPALCSSKPAQLTTLDSTSSNSDWRVSHAFGILAITASTGSRLEASESQVNQARGLRGASTITIGIQDIDRP